MKASEDHINIVIDSDVKANEDYISTYIAGGFTDVRLEGSGPLLTESPCFGMEQWCFDFGQKESLRLCTSPPATP